MLGGIHNNMWIAWEPDEIAIVCLYAMYIPMFIGLMVKCKDFNFFKRFILPFMGVLCCVFMVYCCFVGKGAQQVGGFLIFFAIVMLIGALFSKQKKIEAPKQQNGSKKKKKKK